MLELKNNYPDDKLHTEALQALQRIVNKLDALPGDIIEDIGTVQGQLEILTEHRMRETERIDKICKGITV